MKIKKVYKITVKASHIEKGKQGNAKTCAISLAALDIFKGATVSTTSWSLRINREGENEIYFILPKRAQNFVQKFDNDKDSVKPFVFNVKPSMK